MDTTIHKQKKMNSFLKSIILNGLFFHELQHVPNPYIFLMIQSFLSKASYVYIQSHIANTKNVVLNLILFYITSQAVLKQRYKCYLSTHGIKLDYFCLIEKNPI
jgi:hypothetical protein